VANAIEKVNGITIANMEKLMSRTDANIQNLNGLELTGATPYLPGNPKSNHATAGLGWHRIDINGTTAEGSGSGATYREKTQKVSAGATYTHPTLNVTCDASVETFCVVRGYTWFRVAGSGNTQFVVTIGGSTVYDATTSSSGNAADYSGRANVTASDVDCILTIENERGSDQIWIANTFLGAANFRGDNEGDAPVCTGSAFRGLPASPDDTMSSEGSVIIDDNYLVTDASDDTKTFLRYITLDISPGTQIAKAVTLMVGAGWMMIEDSAGTGEIWFSYHDRNGAGTPTRTTFYTGEASTTASTWDVNNLTTSVVIPASYISNLTETSVGSGIYQLDIEMWVKHSGTGHWFNPTAMAIIAAEIA